MFLAATILIFFFFNLPKLSKVFQKLQISSKNPIQINEDMVVKGTPICRGKYTGVAKVITKVSDAKIIEQGDILITISTDIGWSPYFPLLGGVVTELGGLISHGAVVAREYGLPCVVGAEGATNVFKTGKYFQICNTVSKNV